MIVPASENDCIMDLHKLFFFDNQMFERMISLTSRKQKLIKYRNLNVIF